MAHHRSSGHPAPAPAATGDAHQPRAGPFKPDVPRFQGFTEPDVGAWLDSFETVCKACRVDPATALPNHVVPKLLPRLKQLGAVYDDGGWPALRTLLLATYGRPANKLQLQAALQGRRMSTDETVSQYADALDTIATRLGTKLDDITGLFVAGLPDSIVNSGMNSRSFSTFAEALQVARTIEENLESRKPRAATLITQPISAAALAIVEEPAGPDPIAMATVFAQRHESSSGRQPIMKQDQRYRPFDRRTSSSVDPSTREQNAWKHKHAEETVSCDFCGYIGHSTAKCKLRMELNQRRSASGLPLMIVKVIGSGLHSSPLVTDVCVGGVTMDALIDTGAGATLLGSSMVERLLQFNHCQPTIAKFLSCNGQEIAVTSAVSTTVQLGNRLISGQILHVVTGLPYNIVLGTDFLFAAEAVIDINHEINGGECLPNLRRQRPAC